MKKYIFNIFLLTLVFGFTACEDALVEQPHDQLVPSNVLETEVGLESVLISAYGEMQVHIFPLVRQHYMEEGTTDIFWEQGGGQERHATTLQNFTFDSEHTWITDVYDQLWDAVTDVNQFFDNVDKVEFRNSDKAVRMAEARFIRAYQYYLLSKWYGEVPLITSSTPELYPANTPMSQINEFIEEELIDAAADLPQEQTDQYRINKGGALALLTKHYLNTKQWQKCADAAKDVMDLGIYKLEEDYKQIFSVDNETNAEFILVYPQIRDGVAQGNTWMALSLPPGYPETGPNFAAQFKYYDAFVNSFDLNDVRREMILTEYEKDGQTVQLLGNDDSRSLKYYDVARIGSFQDNDVPIIRYADILLSRAEAINELQGPVTEAIDLINEVRERAEVTPLSVAGFSKESLRDHILAERGWEFYSESKRRSDLIRHGKFVDRAKERGKNAQNYHMLYPFPQTEINANKNLKQNEGY